MKQLLAQDSYELNETITSKDTLATSDDSVGGFFCNRFIQLITRYIELPLASEKLMISKSGLTPYAQSINAKYPTTTVEEN